MKSNKDLVEAFINYVDSLDEDSEATFEDFYKHMKIPKKYRSDFTSSALANGYNKSKELENVQNI